MAGHGRQHDACQVECVEQCVGRLRVAIDQEGQVEGAAVRHHPTRADEVDQLRQDLLRSGRRGDVGISDPGQLLHGARNADFGTDQ